MVQQRAMHISNILHPFLRRRLDLVLHLDSSSSAQLHLRRHLHHDSAKCQDMYSHHRHLDRRLVDRYYLLDPCGVEGDMINIVHSRSSSSDNNGGIDRTD